MFLRLSKLFGNVLKDKMFGNVFELFALLVTILRNYSHFSYIQNCLQMSKRWFYKWQMFWELFKLFTNAGPGPEGHEKLAKPSKAWPEGRALSGPGHKNPGKLHLRTMPENCMRTLEKPRTSGPQDRVNVTILFRSGASLPAIVT